MDPVRRGWGHLEILPATQRGVFVGGDALNTFQYAGMETIDFKILADGPHLRSLEQIQSWLVLVVPERGIFYSFWLCYQIFLSYPGPGF